MIINQIEYYNDTNQRFLNHPEDLTGAQLVDGKIFRDLICDEIQIYAFPEADFIINGQEIHIGPAGVYNILLREKVSIISLQVSQQTINYIKEHDYASLTITFVVHEEEKQNSDSYHFDEDTENNSGYYRNEKNVIHD